MLRIWVNLFLVVLPAFASAAPAYSRKLSFSQVYATPSFADHGGAIVTIKNIANIDQRVKIVGGMKWLLMPAESHNTGLTSFGQYMSGWAVRGAPAGTVISAGATVAPLATNAPLVGGMFGQGVGTNVSATDGPYLKLRPGDSVFLQSERYGSGAHGAFEMDVLVEEARGALIATGIVYTREIVQDPCPGPTCGNVLTASISTTTFVINGNRPF